MLISLKWKIQLWHALVLAVVLVILGAGFYYYEKARRLEQLDWLLFSRVHGLMGPQGLPLPERPGSARRDSSRPSAPRIPGWEPRRGESPGSLALPDLETGQLREHPRERFQKNAVPRGYYARMLDGRTREVLFTTGNFPAVEFPDRVARGFFQRTRDGRYRELLHAAPLGILIIGRDLDAFHAGLVALRWQIIGGSLILFILGVGVGYWLVAKSLSPLHEIQAVASRIAHGNLGHRIDRDVKWQSRELAALTDDLNETFAELERLFERQIQFTADASHELKTPLTALMAQIDIGRRKPRSVEEYLAILEVCSRSADRIKRITQDLTELARYDAGRVDLGMEEVPIDGIIQGLAEELEPSVRSNGSTLVTDLRGSRIVCDPFRLEQVVTNMVSNALQHNDKPVNITIRTRTERGELLLQIIDDGKGIQPENLDRLFDRFYQENAAHAKNRSTANIGLGLAISLAVVQAHGGTIRVESLPGVQTNFSIVLPVPRPA